MAQTHTEHGRSHGAGMTGRPGEQHAAAAMTLPQVFLLTLGSILTLAGIVGFFVNSDFSTGSGVMMDTLIVFHVNGWHNLFHLITGLGALAAASSISLARTGTSVIGIVYLVVLLWGALSQPILGLIPINTPDMVLHLIIAAVAGAVAMAPDVSGRERAQQTGAAHDELGGNDMRERSH